MWSYATKNAINALAASDDSVGRRADGEGARDEAGGEANTPRDEVAERANTPALFDCEARAGERFQGRGPTYGTWCGRLCIIAN